MASGVTTNIGDLIAQMQAFQANAPTLLFQRVVSVLQPVAPTLEQWARDNHAWQNQTGEAEAGLNAGIVEDIARNIVQLFLQHGVDYGIHLETKYGGRDGVIIPALESIMPDIRTALGV